MELSLEGDGEEDGVFLDAGRENGVLCRPAEETSEGGSKRRLARRRRRASSAIQSGRRAKSFCFFFTFESAPSRCPLLGFFRFFWSIRAQFELVLSSRGARGELDDQ